MEPPAAGAVVLVPFPFSDLSQAKLRPAIVLADVGGGDFILCQVTSNPYSDPGAIELTDSTFSEGTLQRISYARPGKLFTAHQSLVRTRIGSLNSATLARISRAVIALLQPPEA